MRIFFLMAALCLSTTGFAAELAAGDHAINIAAKEGSGEEVKKLLKADPALRDVRSPLGSTPLHLAATNPDRSAMTALLAAGADPNARDADGSTPLLMAAYASKPANCQQLLEAGADPLAKTDNGRDAGSMARKVKADETAGVISLWVLKGCKAGKPC